jgi:hypothetical protein
MLPIAKELRNERMHSEERESGYMISMVEATGAGHRSRRRSWRSTLSPREPRQVSSRTLPDRACKQFRHPRPDGIAIRIGDSGVGGRLEVYCKKVRGVTREGKVLREGAEYQYDPPSGKLSIPFAGSTSLPIKGATSLFD